MPHLDSNGWSLDYDLRPGGIVLTNISHQIFSLARDIRTVRVWIGTGDPDPVTSFVLHSPELPATGAGINPLNSSSELVHNTRFFTGYHNLFGLSAAYRSTVPYVSDTRNACNIELEQRFLFTDYGKNPAHEPGGVLDACRLFPILNFRFPAVENPIQPYPKYFRADYRLDVSLDNIAELDVPRLARGQNVPGRNVVRNKAAIFRDKEGPPGVDTAVTYVLAPFTGNMPSLEQLFDAFEKPLQYEIATWGLVRGQRPPRVTRQHTWDNIHMWPSVRPISTPGAFHALHCHWRWGAVAGDPGFHPGLPHSGERQFTGVGWSESEGGPLVDPRIAKQNMRFAVAKNEAAGGVGNASERNFFDLFTGDPESVVQGDDLVLWISFEVFREDTRPWTGDLFINGFYFAHNTDQTPPMVAAAGAYTEGAKPRPAHRWQRLTRR